MVHPITAEDAAALLRGRALRVTSPRVAVLSELSERPHSSVDAIAQGSRDRLGAVSTQAIYDVLAALYAAGLVRRFEPAGHPARYELDLGDNHHHVVCRRCGTMSDVECAQGSTPCLTAGDDHGFAIDEAEVIYWGICPDCAGQTAAPQTSAPQTHP